MNWNWKMLIIVVVGIAIFPGGFFIGIALLERHPYQVEAALGLTVLGVIVMALTWFFTEVKRRGKRSLE